MAIEQIAYFGDSYCADAKIFYEPTDVKPFFWPQKSYIDLLYEKSNIPIIHRGRSGHGPNWTISEFIQWLDSNKELIPTTQFIWCWSDPARTLVKSPPSKYDIDQESLEIGDEYLKFEKSIGATIDIEKFLFVCHPGEMGEPGPDSPMLNELGNCIPSYLDIPKELKQQYLEKDKRWADTFKMYWLYIRNREDQFRRFIATCKLFKYVVKDYSINYIQNYRCFPSNVYKLEKGPNSHAHEQYIPEHEFIYKGKIYENLFDFARLPEFLYDTSIDGTYPNHFSPQGQQAFADIIYARMEPNL